MRVLIVDHYYPAFIESVYRTDSTLAFQTYAEQRTRLDAELFGETVFEAAALRSLGHESWDALVNVPALQASWVREHGGRLPSAEGWGWRLRRGVIPWPRRSNERWIGEAILTQIKILRPDVVHVQCVDLLGAALIREVRDHVRFIVGQIAAPLNSDRVLAGYDLVVSSLPNFVDRFRAAGLQSEWLPLAFEPSIVEMITEPTRDVPVSFVGSLSKEHRARIVLLEAVADQSPLSIWTGDADLPASSPLRPRLEGPAWGRHMYQVMARSRVALNRHINVAGGYSNNLRLYEATGMGALLLTDHGSNLSNLFEIDTEVVTYRSASECAEKVAHYLSHPSEATAIAAAGQQRTLREHTWQNRMERLVEMLTKRL